jgi:tetratricopeptide (TPR) repeat protein
MTAFRASLLTLGLALSGAPSGALAEAPADDAATNEAPLVAYSLELGLPEKDNTLLHRSREVRAAAHELERNPPPPGADCAKTLGAGRFADQYRHLAYVQFEAGDFEASIESYQAALECAPRVPTAHAGIVLSYLALGRAEDARTALEQGLAIDPDDRDLLQGRARLDFLEGRWADALARFRLLTLEENRTEFSNYAECLFWLTQRRAGVRDPEVLPHDPKEDGWPLPILETLLGQKTEAQLVEGIREQRGEQTGRELLTEALYYIGERYHADGDLETARKHYAAVVNLRQLNYVEYGMARAELAHIRGQEDPETGQP